MRGLLTLVAAALQLSACATMPKGPGGPLRIVDTTGDFARVHDAILTVPLERRGAAFRQAFASIVPGFYTPERSKMDAAAYDAYLTKGLNNFPARRADVAEVSRRFSKLFDPALRAFESQFGPMRNYPPIYLVVSLGEFDGGTRTLPSGTHLMFGADVIAQLHLKHDIQPFFHHELFHLYHARTFTECDAVWCGLWVEGLATHVAASLNPTASDAELLLTYPEPLRPALAARRSEAICAVLARLDSSNESDLQAIFNSEQLAPGLPPRFGYMVGLWVAEDLSRTRSLRELAAMKPDAVRPAIAASLRSMTKCMPS